MGAGQISYLVPVTLQVQTVSGEQQTFVGCYMLHLGNPGIQSVPPYIPMGIRTANIQAVASDADTASLMTLACTSPPPPAGVVVTFQVAGTEQYKVRLTDSADIEVARKLLAGEAAPRIPNGIVVRGDPDVNVGYTWHIDPASVEFADFTTEVCDGLPSDVEKETITSERYCPWSAEVIAIEEVR